MSDAVFEFVGDLTIYQVQETRDRLREAWEQGTRRFDASQLTNLDGSGAQLIISLVKTAKEQAQNISWVNWSTESKDALKLFGLDEWVNSAAAGR